MSWISRGFRIGLLMLATAAFLNWKSHHAEVSSADGLRCLLQARQIERGDFAGGLIESIDHPLHPLAIAAVHQVIRGGDWPYAWQTSAQAAAALTLVLALIPVYLIGRELCDETTAWLSCLLVFANPVVGLMAVNVLSESTFLLFWAWGLWGAIRFLREGRFVWLPPTIACGALAYLTRPEGLLLHLGLLGTLAILPIHRLTRIYWPRWWAATTLLVVGPALLVGPYIAAKGGIGTRPAVARLIGSAPVAPPEALERQEAGIARQSVVSTYASAGVNVAKALFVMVPLPVALLALIGVAIWRPESGRARLSIFLAMLLGSSLIGLVRLYATAGYCSPHHTLIPGLLLTLAAANGLGWLIKVVAIDAARLGLGEGKLKPGPGVWGIALGLILLLPHYRTMTPYNSSFAAYRQAGAWLAEHPGADDEVLDLTDWSLFFSERRGASFAEIAEARNRPEIRFVVVRDAQQLGKSGSSEVVRALVGTREAVARFPERQVDGQLQIKVYDLSQPPVAETARGGKTRTESKEPRDLLR